MWFSSMLRNPKRSGLAKRRRTPAVSRQRSIFRPQLEALEDRWMPSTLTVLNAADGGPASLRAEIAAAHNKDKIVFAPSLNGQTITLTSGALDIYTKNLTIQGPGAAQLTVSGNHDSGVFVVEPGASVTLSGLAIFNGIALQGGGIYNAGTLTVSGCTLSSNAASFSGGPYTGDGGGIYNAGSLTVSGCTLSNNSAFSYGGAIYNSGMVTVSSCTVDQNYAQFGGGIYNGTFNAAMLTVSNSVFSYNFGGDIYGPYTNGGGNHFS
jgi:predicted outer membrane repeat protein